MAVDAMSSVCYLGILEFLNEGSITEILESWDGFCFPTESLVECNGDHRSFSSEFVSLKFTLFASTDFNLSSNNIFFAPFRFRRMRFSEYYVSLGKYILGKTISGERYSTGILGKTGRTEYKFGTLGGEYQDVNKSHDKVGMDLDNKNKLPNRTGDMEIDGLYPHGRLLENNKLMKNIGKVVHDLRSFGFSSMAEDAYASTVFMLLKAKVNDLADDDYREAIKWWIQAAPLQFLCALLAFLGETVSYGSPSSSLRSVITFGITLVFMLS